MEARRILQALANGARLACPRCGRGGMFAGLFKMRVECPDCRFKFEREQGYFVGAMYINYAVTVFIAFSGYFALGYFAWVPLLPNLLLWGAFSMFFPVFFFRYSRGLWLNLDCAFNPPEAVNGARDEND